MSKCKQLALCNEIQDVLTHVCRQLSCCGAVVVNK